MNSELEHVARWLIKAVWDELTPEEERRLKEWVEASDVNRRVYERVVHENEISARYSLWKTLDERRALKNIHRRMMGEGKRRLRWLPYAAVIVMAVSVSLWLNSRGDDPAQVAAIEIPPEERKAELLLESGEKLELTGDVDDQWQVDDAELSLHANVLSYVTTESSRPGYNTLSVPRGTTFIVSLSDGTRVHLNAMSSIKYPVPFPAGERRVFLTGQAYFDVRPERGRPFVVETVRHVVSVSGTSFDVKAYADEERVETTLCSGSVDITLPDRERYTLHPGEQFVLRVKENRVDIKEVNTDITTSWTRDNFYFYNNTLEEIFTELQRWFYVEVEFVNNSKRDQTFSGKFSRFKNMETILNVMKKAGIEIKREGRIIRIE